MSDSKRSLAGSILNNSAYQEVSSNPIVKIIQSETDTEVVSLLELIAKSNAKPAIFHNGIVY